MVFKVCLAARFPAFPSKCHTAVSIWRFNWLLTKMWINRGGLVELKGNNVACCSEESQGRHDRHGKYTTRTIKKTPHKSSLGEQQSAVCWTRLSEVLRETENNVHVLFYYAFLSVCWKSIALCLCTVCRCVLFNRCPESIALGRGSASLKIETNWETITLLEK